MEGNIFDEAAKSPKKATPTDDGSFKIPQIPKGNLTKDQLNEMFARAARMHKEIEEKLQEVYDKTGMTRKQLQDYMKNPKNFTVKQWNAIQVGRKDWQNKLYNLIGQEYKARREKQVEEKSSKERKQKTLGARKNWIPMR